MFSLNVPNENVSIRRGKINCVCNKINCVCNKSLKQNRICFSNKVDFWKKITITISVVKITKRFVLSTNRSNKMHIVHLKKQIVLVTQRFVICSKIAPKKMHLVIITMVILCVKDLRSDKLTTLKNQNK